MRFKLLLLITILFVAIPLRAQEKLKLALTFLENDKITNVNIDNEKYIEDIKNVVNLVEKEFKDTPSNQYVSIKIITHKVGLPTVRFFSSPEVDKRKEKAFLKKLKAIKMENTKIVDFPIHITINNDAAGFRINYLNSKKELYRRVDLKQKYDLNKKWAIEEVLPVLAAYQVLVEDTIAGVKNFGLLTASTKFDKKQDVAKLTSVNSNYWRAIMEMESGNQLIPVTKIFMLVSQGELDQAFKYLEIIKMVSDRESIADFYLSELKWRMGLFNEQLNAEIEKGVIEHDKGNYQTALKIYNDILKIYPNSAWALYELYFSKNAMEVEKGIIDANYRHDWDNAKIDIYRSNPLYGMDVRAGNGKEGYLMYRRQEISMLFKDKDNSLSDIYKYADIALDLGIYDFAAQLFWLTFTFNENEKVKESSLHKYLYSLEKLEIKDLKSNFKGNFNEVFKDIEKEKEKLMKENVLYKKLNN